MNSLDKNMLSLFKNAWKIKSAKKSWFKKSNLDLMDSFRNITSLLFYYAKHYSAESYVGLVCSLKVLGICIDCEAEENCKVLVNLDGSVSVSEEFEDLRLDMINLQVELQAELDDMYGFGTADTQEEHDASYERFEDLCEKFHEDFEHNLKKLGSEDLKAYEENLKKLEILMEKLEKFENFNSNESECSIEENAELNFLWNIHKTYFAIEGWENLAKKNNLDLESDTIYRFYLDIFDKEFENLPKIFKTSFSNLGYYSLYREKNKSFSPTIVIEPNAVKLDFTDGIFVNMELSDNEDREWYIKECRDYFQEELSNDQLQDLAEENYETLETSILKFKENNKKIDFLSLEVEILPKKRVYKHYVRLLKFIDRDIYMDLYNIVTELGGIYAEKGFSFSSDALAREFINLMFAKETQANSLV